MTVEKGNLPAAVAKLWKTKKIVKLLEGYLKYSKMLPLRYLDRMFYNWLWYTPNFANFTSPEQKNWYFMNFMNPWDDCFTMTSVIHCAKEPESDKPNTVK